MWVFKLLLGPVCSFVFCRFPSFLFWCGFLSCVVLKKLARWAVLVDKSAGVWKNDQVETVGFEELHFDSGEMNTDGLAFLWK